MAKTVANKKSKKEQKAFNALNRVMTNMNTGTRVMKSNKDYNRQKAKLETKKAWC